ncbi:MAG: hypothetical protein EPO11_08090 [Gammaproteobacteria bacterium]|nr:MAG: hypothetical protein EPO11_08090 [Gammaproteobacteria bacterium]
MILQKAVTIEQMLNDPNSPLAKQRDAALATLATFYAIEENEIIWNKIESEQKRALEAKEMLSEEIHRLQKTQEQRLIHYLQQQQKTDSTTQTNQTSTKMEAKIALHFTKLVYYVDQIKQTETYLQETIQQNKQQWHGAQKEFISEINDHMSQKTLKLQEGITLKDKNGNVVTVISLALDEETARELAEQRVIHSLDLINRSPALKECWEQDTQKILDERAKQSDYVLTIEDKIQAQQQAASQLQVNTENAVVSILSTAIVGRYMENAKERYGHDIFKIVQLPHPKLSAIKNMQKMVEEGMDIDKFFSAAVKIRNELIDSTNRIENYCEECVQHIKEEIDILQDHCKLSPHHTEMLQPLNKLQNIMESKQSLETAPSFRKR